MRATRTLYRLVLSLSKDEAGTALPTPSFDRLRTRFFDRKLLGSQHEHQGESREP